MVIIKFIDEELGIEEIHDTEKTEEIERMIKEGKFVVAYSPEEEEELKRVFKQPKDQQNL